MKKTSKFTVMISVILIFVISLCQLCFGAEMTYKNGILEVSGLEGSAKAICASYDTNKVLTGVKITDVTNGTNNLNAKTGDKIFLWQSLEDIKPLSEVLTVKNTDKSNNILIVYFSRAGENWQVGNVEKGNTAVIAGYIKEKVNADVFEISPVNPYPEGYNDTLDIVQHERYNNERPEFKGAIENFDQYDTVFLGYPIWYGGLPKIMYTFLEKYDMSGKTVIPFSTHGGSGWGSTKTELNTLCPNAEFADGFSIAGTNARNSQADVEKWINELGLNTNNKENTENKEQGEFDLQKGTVMLNNGIEMPILGIGTYQLSSSQAENSVYWALKDGYRLIDTARIYGNEEGIGRGIKRAIDEGFVTRDEIFVTTKMWTSDFGNGDAAIDASLKRLDLDYIDLMILHHSQPSNDVEAYQAMERAVKDGKLRSIGLSNFYTASDFDRLTNATEITPALLQNETHPYYQSAEMKEHLKKYGTVLESWFPLGGRGNTQVLFNDETISAIAKAHNKTSAQIILRWHLQAGNIAIPGSSNEAHIQENYEIFDFELNDDEMQKIAALDKKQRFASY